MIYVYLYAFIRCVEISDYKYNQYVLERNKMADVHKMAAAWGAICTSNTHPSVKHRNMFNTGSTQEMLY